MALDVSACILDVWYRLGFSSADDLANETWLTVAELYQFLDDAVKALGRSTGVFLTYDATIAVTPGLPTYALPARHVFTESAWLLYADGHVQLLRLTGVGQLFALDANWPTTLGDPTRLSLDAQDVETCILYPVPLQNATLAQVCETYPADVALGGAALALNPVLQDMLTYAALAGARSKESDSRDGDMAKHFAARVAMYQAIVESLWGSGN